MVYELALLIVSLISITTCLLMASKDYLEERSRRTGLDLCFRKYVPEEGEKPPLNPSFWCKPYRGKICINMDMNKIMGEDYVSHREGYCTRHDLMDFVIAGISWESLLICVYRLFGGGVFFGFDSLQCSNHEVASLFHPAVKS